MNPKLGVASALACTGFQRFLLFQHGYACRARVEINTNPRLTLC